jgi:hypothetical protein
MVNMRRVGRGVELTSRPPSTCSLVSPGGDTTGTRRQRTKLSLAQLGQGMNKTSPIPMTARIVKGWELESR